MQIASNTVASIDYTLTDDEGRVLDSSAGREPLQYLHGVGQLIPGLESALEGQSEGSSLAVTVAPTEAYGERDEQLVQEVSRSAFESIDRVEPGMQFQVRDAQGHGRTLTVTDVGQDTVTVDANHPLAGKQLRFKVDVVEVRPATDAEIEQGSVASA